MAAGAMMMNVVGMAGAAALPTRVTSKASRVAARVASPIRIPSSATKRGRGSLVCNGTNDSRRARVPGVDAGEKAREREREREGD